MNGIKRLTAVVITVALFVVAYPQVAEASYQTPTFFASLSISTSSILDLAQQQMVSYSSAELHTQLSVGSSELLATSSSPTDQNPDTSEFITVTYTPSGPRPYYALPDHGAGSWGNATILEHNAIASSGAVYARVGVEVGGWAEAVALQGVRFTAEGSGTATVNAKIHYAGAKKSLFEAMAGIGVRWEINDITSEEQSIYETDLELSFGPVSLILSLVPVVGPVIGTMASAVEVGAALQEYFDVDQIRTVEINRTSTPTFTWLNASEEQLESLTIGDANVEIIMVVDDLRNEILSYTILERQTFKCMFIPPDGYALYEFYSIATDRAGNVEAPPGVADASCGVVIPATIDIDPDTLNLKSQGRWITAYIELPSGYDLASINVGTITLEGAVPAEAHPTEIGDHNGDGIPDLMVKFDRSAVQALLGPGGAELTVTGMWHAVKFKGADVIRVIDFGEGQGQGNQGGNSGEAPANGGAGNQGNGQGQGPPSTPLGQGGELPSQANGQGNGNAGGDQDQGNGQGNGGSQGQGNTMDKNK